jgi:hypothetical protein
MLLLMPLLMVCAAHPGLRRIWSELGRSRQIYLGVFLFCMLLGVASGAHRATYPFVAGMMYGQNMPGAKYIEYRASFASGRVDETRATSTSSTAPRTW